MSPRRSRTPAPSVASPHPHANPPSDALATFHANVGSGSFTAVLGRDLRRALRDAAADTGLEAEVGALRLALARLLAEERDPTRLAAGVARLAGVAVQAARLRHNPNSELDEIRATLRGVLAAYDAELAAENDAAPGGLGAGWE